MPVIQNDVIATRNIAPTQNQPMRRWMRVPLRMNRTAVPGAKATRAPAMCHCTIAGARRSGVNVTNGLLRGRRGAVCSGSALRVAALVHEAVELFAVASAAQPVEIFGKFALGLDELAALFLEPGEFRVAPIVEGASGGRAQCGATALPRARPAAAPCLRAAPALRLCRHLIASIGEKVAGIAFLLLRDLEGEDGETNRPEDDKADDHRRQFQGMPAAASTISLVVIPRAVVDGIRIGTHDLSSRIA